MSWMSHPEFIACCPWPRLCDCKPQRPAIDLSRSGENWAEVLEQLERTAFETVELPLTQLARLASS